MPAGVSHQAADVILPTDAERHVMFPADAGRRASETVKVKPDLPDNRMNPRFHARNDNADEVGRTPYSDQLLRTGAFGPPVMRYPGRLTAGLSIDYLAEERRIRPFTLIISL
jgi:hypothetical protein